MQTGTEQAPVSKRTLWIGIILGAVPVLMLLMSAIMKLTRQPQAVEGFAAFGYPANTLIPIGIAELVCTILYVIPRTSVFGAIMLTGYLGGAVATHVHAGQRFEMAVVVAALAWVGLYLREPRLRELVPFRR
jgi:uncharacterized membrane protein YphA (DoxX/SURF4 family)